MAQVFHWPAEGDEDCGGWPVEKQVVLELFEVARGLVCLVVCLLRRSRISIRGVASGLN